MSVLATVGQLCIFAGAAASSIMVAATMDWTRVFLTALGRQHQLGTHADDRWRRVHLDADARPPFHKIRVAAPPTARLRGLFGRRSPR